MKIDPSIAALKASNDELAATRQLLKETVLDREAHRARLAEAERLLKKHFPHFPRVGVAEEVDAFLYPRATNSATVCDATSAQLAEAQRLLHSADPIIHAQHDETGRMWTGPRSQLPRRYFECSAPGITP